MEYRCTRCQTPGKIGVSMMACSACPNSYHIQCLGYNFVPFIPTRWYCPSHWSSSCRICMAQNMLPAEPQKRCFACGSVYCAIHLHTAASRQSNLTEDSLFACAYCLDENGASANNKRKKDSQEDESSVEPEKKRQKTSHAPTSAPSKTPASVKQEKKVAITVEMMNQIISTMSPSAPPLHVQTAPIRKKKRADVRETPDPQLIKRIKDALVVQQLHQKDLADILEVSPSTISSYFNNKSRSNGWKDLESKLSDWLQTGAGVTSGSGDVPSRSNDSPASGNDAHSSETNAPEPAQQKSQQSAVHQAVIHKHSATNLTAVTYEAGSGKLEATYAHLPSNYYLQTYAPQISNVYQQNTKPEPFLPYAGSVTPSAVDSNDKAGYYTQTNYHAAISGYSTGPSLSMMDGFQPTHLNAQLMYARYGRGEPLSNPHSLNSSMHGDRPPGLQ